MLHIQSTFLSKVGDCNVKKIDSSHGINLKRMSLIENTVIKSTFYAEWVDWNRKK